MAQTYRQLKSMIDSIPEGHLDDNVTTEESDEFFQTEITLKFYGETDILDEGHPFLVIRSEAAYLEDIKTRFLEDQSEELFEILFQHYEPEMPYGTAKARTGDPYEWIRRRIEQERGGV